MKIGFNYKMIVKYFTVEVEGERRSHRIEEEGITGLSLMTGRIRTGHIRTGEGTTDSMVDNLDTNTIDTLDTNTVDTLDTGIDIVRDKTSLHSRQVNRKQELSGPVLAAPYTQAKNSKLLSNFTVTFSMEKIFE